MPLAIGALIVVALLLVWAGVEVDHLVTAYPAESIFAVASVTVISAAVVAARFRAANKRVPLSQPARGTVLEAAPVRPAIRPSPPPRAQAPDPAPSLAKAGDKCDGPRCEERLDDNPWKCEGTFPDGHDVGGRFHSEGCMEAWQRLMTERHRASR
jgi:hypothetical protein